MRDACGELGVFLAKDVQLGRNVIVGQMFYLKGLCRFEPEYTSVKVIRN